MVLDEDALEAMLRRQNQAPKGQPVELTHETEEFAVYERPPSEDDEEEEVHIPIPEPSPEPAMDEPSFEEIPVPAPEAAIVPDAFQAMDSIRDSLDPSPQPVAKPTVVEEEPDIVDVPTPEPAPQMTFIPEPEPVQERPRTHAPTPTSHNHAPSPAPSRDGEGPRIAIVQALFNQELTDMMTELAKAKARKLGAQVTHEVTVPGVYDLPLLTKALLERDDVDCAVVIGVVVQGETKHDELITHATAATLQDITLQTGKPIGLGITGPGMTWAQAEARVANGAHAVEAAVVQVRALQTA